MKNIVKLFATAIFVLMGLTGCHGDPDINTDFIYRNECSEGITMKCFYNLDIKAMEQDTISMWVFGLPEVNLGEEVVVTNGAKEAVFRRKDDAPIYYRENYKVLESGEYWETLLFTFTDDMFE